MKQQKAVWIRQSNFWISTWI